MIRSRRDIKQVGRLVVKIGSSLLADEKAGLKLDVIGRLVDEVAVLIRQGLDVVIVTSGAVALGRVRMGWVGRSLSVHEKQAAAAIGQPLLMHAYGESFARHDLAVAQMLLTKDDLRNRRRYLNASNTSHMLFSAGVVPIVNENDTVVVDEIKFGDNDTLGALTSLVVDAELMVMLTDVDGLYEADPARHASARRIGEVDALTPEILAMAGDTRSHFGTGGMASKLKAARMATRGGVAAAIVGGNRPGAMARLLAGEDEGTLFLCGTDRQARRKHWIAELLQPAGILRIDAGAERALLGRGSSLLPIGLTAVEGIFDKGECVEVFGPSGRVARGLANYNAEEMRRLVGVASQDIEAVLGYRDFSSVIHRDNLVLCRPETEKGAVDE
jgi:glutamate 5-kinase